MLDCERPSLERQLVSNQVWETIAFIAKAAFMLGLTPWMIRTWGAQGYGEFALASSTFVLLSLFDLGIRAKTRVALCSAGEKDRGRWPSILAHSGVAFAAIGAITIAAAFVLTASGILSSLFKISSANRNLLFITTTMSILVMFSGLLLEPLVAIGRIGKLKLATAGGWLAAIPCVAAVLAVNGPVSIGVIAWLGCLLATNLLLLFQSGILHASAIKEVRCDIGLRKMIATVKGGFWFTVTNTTWMAKTYGTTFLISALNGPATAGLFFILLRLSEIISGLGAISSDVSLGELAHAKTVTQRRQSFESSYSWAVLFCVHIGLVIGFSTNAFFEVWLHPTSPLSPLAGVVVVMLGFGSALNRTATFAAMSLGVARTAAKWGVIEAATFILMILAISSSYDLLIKLGLASLSAVALFPLIVDVSRSLRRSSIKVWLSPFRSVTPFAVASASVLLVSTVTGQATGKAGAVVICGGIAFLNVISWRRTSRPSLENLQEEAVISGAPC